MKKTTEEYITIEEAAEIVGKSERTIRRWIAKDLLEIKRFPPKTGKVYIRKTDIPTFIRK